MGRILAALLAAALASSAAVRTVEITERSPVLDGRKFGAAGAYERIAGRVHFTLDPKASANRIVRDLEFARTDAAGLVECAADFYILQPVQPLLANGTVLFEVTNRGGKAMLNRFNFANGGSDPRTAADFGDGYTLEQGYTLVWLGWEWDLPPNPGLLHFAAPHFRPNGPTAGLVRSEYSTDRKTTSMSLGDRSMDPVPLAKAVALYVRDTVQSPPRAIPATEWKLSADAKSLELPAGFEPGKLYEFVYQGKDPVVAGTGLAAVRDFISFLKFGGPSTPLGDDHRRAQRAIGFGISQSGRFLREFLYDGFNTDEQGRKVFDGVWADVAGAGRGSFNFRYAQPSRDGHPFVNIFYPTDLFPFTDSSETDPVTGITDSLLARARAAKAVPKLFLTNNSYEFWGRDAGLIAVTADGTRDQPLSPETRFYFVAGVQHGPRSLPLVKSGTRYLVNPVDHRPIQRALLGDLQAWLKEGTVPPESVHPTLAAGQLTTREALKFPPIEGVLVPKYPRPARRLDLGPEFATQGVIRREPPNVNGAYPLLIPQVDADGMDLGGIRLPEIAVPLATITGWNLRAPERGAPEEIAEFLGSIFPFPKTKEERAHTQDPRLTIAERYTGRDDYLKRAAAAADNLIHQRFLLPADRAFALDRAARLWDALVQ